MWAFSKLRLGVCFSLYSRSRIFLVEISYDDETFDLISFPIACTLIMTDLVGAGLMGDARGVARRLAILSPESVSVTRR